MTAFLRPEAHRSEYHHGRAPSGRATSGPEISVDTDDERSFVRLTLDPLPGETFDDRDVDRIFTADEARTLAALLVHHADELDRWHR